jgi:hypothetical protein
MVRVLFTILILVFVGWSGYWWVGSTAQQTAITAWLEGRRAAGWVADYDSLAVQGFPNRFDTRVVNLNLADPSSGWAWRTPEFQVLMLSYKPTHVIAVLPPQTEISSPNERITITSKDIRASVKFDPNTALALNSTTAELSDVTLTSTAGWTSHMESATLASRQTAGVANSHDLYFQATNLKPALIFKNIIDPNALLPDVFETVRADFTAGFDAPWDRVAVEGRKPELLSLELKDYSAVWGSLEFQAKGSLTFDTLGSPTGKIAVRAKNWQDMLSLGVSAGFVPIELESTLQSGLSLLARFSGNPDTIDAPLSFANGVISLGPIPIGRAPKLRLN